MNEKMPSSIWGNYGSGRVSMDSSNRIALPKSVKDFFGDETHLGILMLNEGGIKGLALYTYDKLQEIKDKNIRRWRVEDPDSATKNEIFFANLCISVELKNDRIVIPEEARNFAGITCETGVRIVGVTEYAFITAYSDINNIINDDVKNDIRLF